LFKEKIYKEKEINFSKLLFNSGIVKPYLLTISSFEVNIILFFYFECMFSSLCNVEKLDSYVNMNYYHGMWLPSLKPIALTALNVLYFKPLETERSMDS